MTKGCYGYRRTCAWWTWDFPQERQEVGARGSWVCRRVLARAVRRISSVSNQRTSLPLIEHPHRFQHYPYPGVSQIAQKPHSR